MKWLIGLYLLLLLVESSPIFDEDRPRVRRLTWEALIGIRRFLVGHEMADSRPTVAQVNAAFSKMR